MSEQDALFTYNANYRAPGRWGVEVLTSKHRFIFKPMEKLQVQNIGSFKVEECEIEDELDHLYKPGIYREVTTFIKNSDSSRFKTVEQQICAMKYYYSMLNGKMWEMADED